MADNPSPAAPAIPTLKALSNEVDSVVDWFSLGVKLELDYHVLKKIEKDHHGDNVHCKYEMLDHWLRNAKQPTWKAMADALCQLREHRVAFKLQTKYCSSSTAPDAETSTVTSPQSPTQSPSAVAVTRRNIQKIQGKFGTLVIKTRRRLQDRVNIEDIQMFLITVNSSPNSKDGSRMVTTVVETATNLQEIFCALSKYGLWDYLNYYLLQSIIEEFAHNDDELNGMVKQYQEDLTGHILTLKIQEYLDAIDSMHSSIVTSNGEDSSGEVVPAKPNFKKLSVKVEANITDHSLSYVNDLWQSLAHQFLLPRPAMILQRIAVGCIGISWLIPANLVDYVTKQAQETSNIFTEQHILRVMLGEQCIYPMETNPTLRESETAALKRKRDSNEGIVGDLQASEPDCEEVHEHTKKENPESRGDPDAGNLSTLQRIQQLIDDEPEDPEVIPEHKQYMIYARVVRTNYSLLYSGLDTGRLLPKLPDKDLIDETQIEAARSYHQQFAQNSILIQAQLRIDRPSNGLLKFCDTLETTPGQEHIAKTLLQDYKDCIKNPSAVSACSRLPSVPTAVHSELSAASELFKQLQLQVMDLLDCFPNALAKLKQVIASIVLPLGEGKTARLVDPLSYEGAYTVRELFRLMSPYWNPLSADLLSLLLECLSYKEAAVKVAKFSEVRRGMGLYVLCVRQLPTLASGQNDVDVADLETVHNAPLSELQSLHPAVFARLPEHKCSPTRKTIRISVEVDKPLLCIADYEDIVIALSGFFQVPKAGLVYCGCSKAPLVLCWLASHELLAYMTSVVGGTSGDRLLVESSVIGIAIGDRVYKCPTLKDVELLEACRHGLVRQVPYLLLTGANVNAARCDGGTALEQASIGGHQKVVELLLGEGANPDLQDKTGSTAMYFACQYGHLPIVECLIGAKAGVNHQNEIGGTPLYIACEKGYLPVVECLIGAKADVNYQKKDGCTPLYVTCGKGHLPVVEHLIRAKADVNQQNKYGTTPLYIACQEGHLLVVECLIGAKADVNHKKKDGYTVLMVASYYGHPSVVRALLQAGAMVNTTTEGGATALMAASCNGHLSVVRELLQAGAIVNTTNQDGQTALYFAADRGHENVVELLLKLNADSDLPKKMTALMVAARNGSVEIVRKLIQHGASVNLTDKAGLTAFDIASVLGHMDVCQELTKKP